MKTITLIIISALIMLSGLHNELLANQFSEPLDSLVNDSLIVESPMTDSIIFDSLPTVDQQKEVVTKGDTTYISFGNKKIQIIEKNGQTDVKIKDKNPEEDDFTFDSGEDQDEEKDEDKNSGRKSGKKFKGHWAGLEFGLNNYVDQNYSLNRSDASSFLDINTEKSWNFNWNLFQYSIGFGTDHIGLVTGLGLEWNNYHFKSTTSIHEDNGLIAPLVVGDSSLSRDDITKNRFRTTYLTIPLILETQFFGNKRSKRLYAGVGIITGIKIYSSTKFEYDEDGTEREEKNNDEDFYLSPIRYGLTARLGYRALKLYANYYITPLFLDGRGPEQLNPVSAGLVFSF